MDFTNSSDSAKQAIENHNTNKSLFSNSEDNKTENDPKKSHLEDIFNFDFVGHTSSTALKPLESFSQDVDAQSESLVTEELHKKKSNNIVPSVSEIKNTNTLNPFESEVYEVPDFDNGFENTFNNTFENNNAIALSSTPPPIPNPRKSSTPLVRSLVKSTNFSESFSKSYTGSELAKSKSFHDNNVPLPKIPSQNENELSSSLIPLENNEKNLVIPKEVNDDASAEQPSSPQQKNSSTHTKYVVDFPSTPLAISEPPTPPPKDQYLLNLAPRSSRLEPLCFNRKDFRGTNSFNDNELEIKHHTYQPDAWNSNNNINSAPYGLSSSFSPGLGLQNNFMNSSGYIVSKRGDSPPLPSLPPGGVASNNELAIRQELLRQSQIMEKTQNLPPHVVPYAVNHTVPCYYGYVGFEDANSQFDNQLDSVNMNNNQVKKQKFQKYMKRPWVVYLLTVVQTIMFVVEFIRMGILTGSPIQTQPIFNPMIGPSSYLLINMGARFTPCMHGIKKITDSGLLTFPCPNSTTPNTNTCSLAELCGMKSYMINTDEQILTVENTKDDQPASLKPNQWWRFITPIFLHAGIIHLAFNMILQVRLGGEIERNIGHIRFTLVYFVAGIGGFLLGGNFSPDGIVSTGASGSLFGLIALDLLDLLFNWSVYKNPYRALLLHIFEFVVSFVIGLLPGLDNFSHIGGFLMGILMGTVLLPSPHSLQQKKQEYQRKHSRNKTLGEDETIEQVESSKQQQNVGQTTNEYEDISLVTFEKESETSAGRKEINEFTENLNTEIPNLKNDSATSFNFHKNSDKPVTTNISAEFHEPQREISSPFGDENYSDMLDNRKDPNNHNNTSHSEQSDAPLEASASDTRKPRYLYTWITIRVICACLVLIYFVGLIVNFKNGGGHCSWCKYLSCLPIHGWCEIGNIKVPSASNGSAGAVGYSLILFFFFVWRKIKGKRA